MDIKQFIGVQSNSMKTARLLTLTSLGTFLRLALRWPYRVAGVMEHSRQAIALFFYAIKTHKSSYLGTGVSVADIVQEIFWWRREGRGLLPLRVVKGFWLLFSFFTPEEFLTKFRLSVRQEIFGWGLEGGDFLLLRVAEVFLLLFSFWMPDELLTFFSFCKYAPDNVSRVCIAKGWWRKGGRSIDHLCCPSSKWDPGWCASQLHWQV